MFWKYAGWLQRGVSYLLIPYFHFPFALRAARPLAITLFKRSRLYLFDSKASKLASI